MKRIDFTNTQVASSQTARDINRGVVLNLIRRRQPISRADLARVSVTSPVESFSLRTLDGRNSTLRERLRTPRACEWRWKTPQTRVYLLRFGLDTENRSATSSSSLFLRGSAPGCSRTDN